MNILILGMDNTGKTTLAEKLSERLKIKLVKSPGKGLTKQEMRHFIIDNSINPEDKIFERFCFFEEMVYGKILRGGSKFNFTDDVFWTIKNLLDPIIIYCRPKKSTIKDWKNREQMEGVIDNSDILLREYDKTVKKAALNGLKVIKYNYKKENVEDVISKIRKLYGSVFRYQ